ncbi:MAG: hypothetical protein K2X27_27295, partial [Candidatus Obscuribacterales bacterium]|nr:hypothetical protein [Candidatus Obscuribacterales bacterium]
GTLIMATQSDIKRKLDFSTVGQMGFMCLQCSLGATSAAVFHLLAHGLFKGYFFLQSGSAVSEAQVKKSYERTKESLKNHKAVIAALLILAPASLILYCNPAESGKTVLSVLITTGFLLATMPSLNLMSVRDLCLLLLPLISMMLGSASLSQSFTESLKAQSHSNTPLFEILLLSMALVSLTMYLAKQTKALKALYVHSLNGFYVEELAATFLSDHKAASLNSVKQDSHA